MSKVKFIIQELRFAYQPLYPEDAPPMKKGDIYHVFHGFRSSEDAVFAATRGLSGKTRANRVYSYEANNNPRGLFVTPDMKRAKDFTGGGYPRVIIEFVVREEDLEPPVWPGGSFTGQGQMASMWKSPGERSRAKSAFGREAARDPELAQHHRPGLASTFLYSGERQALFTGDLNPNQIKRFWVAAEHGGRYVPMKRAEFLNFVKEQQQPKDPEGRKLFRPNDNFDPRVLILGLQKTFMRQSSPSEIVQKIKQVFKIEVQRRTPFPQSSFGKLVWPKQQAPLLRWLKSL